MENAFRTVINMSVTGSYVILAVLVVRLLLTRAPKKYSLILWTAAGFRLCCPFSFESMLSLFRLPVFDMTTAQAQDPAILTYIPQNTAVEPITSGISAVNVTAAPVFTPAPESSAPVFDWLATASWVWFTGVILLTVYSLISYLSLRRRVSAATRVDGQVYRSDAVTSPFILGFIHPKIYLPASLSGPKLEYVLAHERMHLKKLDHFHKLLAYGILVLHWFNPLCHLAFRLMSRDMEMRCDEAVLAQNPDIRSAYSTTLVNLAVRPASPLASPLAFGETSVHARVKNILAWKQPRAMVRLAAAALCAVSLVACATNPAQNHDTVEYRPFDLLYSNPSYSATFHYISACQPNYRISGHGELSVEHDGEWWVLGSLEEFELTEENFDRFFPHSDVQEDGLIVYSRYNGASLRKQVVSARKVEVPYDTGGVISYDVLFYYVLETDNGDVYVASGFGKSDDPSYGAMDKLVCMIPVSSSSAMPLEAETYVTSRCIYLTPLSSSFMQQDSGYTYSVEDDLLVIRHRQSHSTQEAFILRGLEWSVFPYSEAEWNRMTFSTDYEYFKDARFLDISLRYFLLEKDGALFFCDGTHEPGEATSMLSTIYQLTGEGSADDPWMEHFIWYDYHVQRLAELGADWKTNLHTNTDYASLTQTYDAELVLRYCFTRFLNMDAEGQEGIILAEVCREILKNHGEQDIIGHSYTDGMDWFRQYQAQAKGYLNTLGARILFCVQQEIAVQ